MGNIKLFQNLEGWLKLTTSKKPWYKSFKIIAGAIFLISCLVAGFLKYNIEVLQLFAFVGVFLVTGTSLIGMGHKVIDNKEKTCG